MHNVISPYLRLQDVADILHVTPQTVRVYIRTGRLPQPARLGRKYLWRAADIEAALNPRAQEEVAHASR